MNPRFKTFRSTDLGRKIEELARHPDRLVEFMLLSRLNMPAVVALSWQVKPLLNELSDMKVRDSVKQYCGAIVGEIMREHGYLIVNPRGSAQSGGVFTLGAVWASGNDDDGVTMKIALQATDEDRETFEALAKS